MSTGRSRLDKYQKLDKIGEGNFGVVYKARDNISGELFALKKISLVDDDEGIPCTAIREISMLKKLQHPNIVRLHDVLYSDRKLTIVFEYLDGDLKKLLDAYSESGLDIATTKSYLYQILRGACHCHINRVLHRDIKPQNLLINREGAIKLADFGLARAFTMPVRRYANEVVTLWYRSPDILLGSINYGTSVDSWSIGCIFAELLNGKPLFQGKSATDQLKLIFSIRGSPDVNGWHEAQSLPNYQEFESTRGVDLRDVVPRLDQQGRDLLGKLLELNPDYRITPEEALEHPYLDEVPDLIKNMSQQVALNMLKISSPIASRGYQLFNCQRDQSREDDRIKSPSKTIGVTLTPSKQCIRMFPY